MISAGQEIGYGGRVGDPQASERRSRRAPAAGERQRDPERTKARILAAAVAEFGEKGYAAARVSEIAAQAGVNKQLISYYFDGKEGLYREVNRRWGTTAGHLTAPELPVAEIAAGFVRSNGENRSRGRMLVWENLSEDFPQDPDHGEFFQRQVEDLRRRQAEGELPADLDPHCFLLAMIAIASAPLTLPRMARQICGEDPASPEFTERYAEQVAKIVRHIQG